MTIEIESTQNTQRPQRIDIGDGLVMRWSTKKDADNIANSMAIAFRWTGIGEPVPEDEIPAPNEWVKAAVKRLMRGNSPVMTEFDYAVVENTLAKDGENPIVACICLQHVPGFYGEKVSLQFGKPEAVSSQPAYRNKGLIRRLFHELIHPASDSRGDVIQIIPGIPHFYRQFGYEYALGIRNSRTIDNIQTKLPALVRDKDDTTPEPFSLRVPTLDDLPYLCKLSTRQAQRTQAQVGLEYQEKFWRYIIHDVIETQASKYDVSRHTRIIVDTATGKDCGIIMGSSAPILALYIFTLEDGYSYRDALYPVLRQYLALDNEPTLWERKLAADKKKDMDTEEKGEEPSKDCNEQAKPNSESKPSPESPKPPKPLRLHLDPDHPITKLLETQSTPDDRRNIRLYTRIPSYANFILKVAPSLEYRLAQSCLAGITATLQFDFFRKVTGTAGRGLEVVIENGKIISARDDFVPPTDEQRMLATRERKALAKAEGRPDKKPTVFTAQFAPLTFTRLLVGDLSIQEMIYFYTETSVEGGPDAKMMLDILFPKHKEQFQFDMFYW
ncbi:hypothetical protein FBU30_008334 [Linnemannia zychae]|nr:hypothetical protein FBU30_008334 [Linnemannia zychae]